MVVANCVHDLSTSLRMAFQSLGDNSGKLGHETDGQDFECLGFLL